MIRLFKRTLSSKKAALRNQVMSVAPLRIVLGSANIGQEGWIPTDANNLNITDKKNWKEIFGRYRIDALMAEHVWEHLSREEARKANRLCFQFLKPGGRLRIAVPDGFNPDSAYLEHVRVGGSGPGARDHKVLYNYRNLTPMLRGVGFHVELLEYWDEAGQFHFVDWSSDGGHIRRSRCNDPRNRDGKLNYTSLIVDALKPI